MVSGRKEGSNFIFPQAKEYKTPYDRFLKGFKRVLKTDPRVREVLATMGLSAVDFGSHSFRKGAVTFCLGGMMAGPNAVIVFIRAGWTLNGVEARYALYDKVGDQFCGRCVAMLPLDRADFASLPPSPFLNACPKCTF